MVVPGVAKSQCRQKQLEVTLLIPPNKKSMKPCRALSLHTHEMIVLVVVADYVGVHTRNCCEFVVMSPPVIILSDIEILVLPSPYHFYSLLQLPEGSLAESS